jgi:DNA polymerase-3 subunit gamma/tau
MAAQALYLKYRPQTFDEVVGQEPITRTLRYALRQGRLRHAYLFTGPRGTGKTTMARLLAKAVNCLAPEEERPCNQCALCTAITEGRLLDLIEIDAASNRGIDEIRDIREKVGFRPNEGRFKVYVLDEAHMLTEPAFNALLKTLEEPPPHVIFTLVTTDPHKIPATITSRCQRFDFKRIPLQGIVQRLQYVAEQEGVTVEPAALELIARQGTGALRDAISLLDQLTSYGDEISLDQVQMVLGTVAGESAARLVSSLAQGDPAAGLDVINRTVGDGADPRQFGREIVEYLRYLLLVKQGAGTQLLNTTAEQAAQLEELADQISIKVLLRAIRLFNEAATDLRRGLQTIPQLSLEMALVESILEDGTPATDTSNAQEAETGPEESVSARKDPVPASTGGSAPAAKPQARRIAESPAVPAETKKGTPAPSSPADPARAATTLSTPAGELSLQQVEREWDQVLAAVRERNPATQAVLNTGCTPVEVNDNEIVVTFPFSFLREKLGDPQRRSEIQDALSEVLSRNCRLRLVLASEYSPRPQRTSTAPPPAAQEPEEQISASEPSASAEGTVPEPISRWAEQHGGEVSIVES